MCIRDRLTGEAHDAVGLHQQLAGLVADLCGGERQLASDPLHLAHGSEGAARRGEGQIVDIGVDRDHSLLPPRRNGHPHRHVAEGEQDAAVGSAPAVEAFGVHGQHLSLIHI